MSETIPPEIASGLCQGCEAKCCTVIGAPLAFRADDDRAREFYEARGYLVKSKAGMLWIYQDNPCPHLAKDFTCKIYNERPQACRDYSCIDDGDILGRTPWIEYFERS